MPKRRLTIKDTQGEIQLFTRRILAISLGIGLLVLLLFARLVNLQLYHHQMYVTLSQKNQLNLVPIEPNRGLIYDRNGVLLAENIPVFSLEVIPQRIKHHIKSTLATLGKIITLTPENLEQFDKQLKQHRRFKPIPLRTRLTEEEVARFSVDQYRFPGVEIKAQLIRHYPLGEKMVTALGYVGRINAQELHKVDSSNYSATNYIGKVGIEKHYEDILHGTVGYQQVEMDATGRIVRVLKNIPPKPGNNLYLTLDSQLQNVAMEALGKQRGAVVAIEPSTGQVLALVSTPSYDPNLFVDGIGQAMFHELRDDPNQPLYNRALRGQYPIASTIKPFMGLAALNSGVIKTDDTIFDPGWFQLPNSEHIYHDWQRTGHGRVAMIEAITNSCDTYFFTVANKMGVRLIDDMLARFGFGQATGIEIDEELAGILPSPAWKRRVQKQAWFPGDTLNFGIGQGYMQATPLQLATATTIIANRGLRFRPSLLLDQQTPDKNVIPQAPMPLQTVELQKSTWDPVIEGMEHVIKEGTGLTHFGNHVQYEVAGKTGTAQVFTLRENQRDDAKILPERLRDHSLFIAFAPTKQPKIAVAVIVEHSAEAGTVARKVIDYYLLKKHT